MPCPIVSEFCQAVRHHNPQARGAMKWNSHPLVDLADELESLEVTACEWTDTLEIKAFVGLLFIHRQLFSQLLALRVESASPYLKELLNADWDVCSSEAEFGLLDKLADQPIIVITNWQLKGCPRTTEQFQAASAEKCKDLIKNTLEYVRLFQAFEAGKLVWPPLPIGDALGRSLNRSVVSMEGLVKVARTLFSITKENQSSWKKMTAAHLSFSE